jgi:hypothetical protein
VLDIINNGHYNIYMSFVRSKKRGNKIYYYLVESYRVDNKVRQRVIKYIGTTNRIKELLENNRKKK